MSSPASNRQKKILRFFHSKISDDITAGAAGWEIARLMASEQNRRDWERYLYVTQDFDSDSDQLKPFDLQNLHRVEVPDDWSADQAKRDFREDLVGRFLEDHSPFDIPAPDVAFRDKVFLFTGKFEFGERKLCQRLVEMAEGSAPSKKGIAGIDYLVVGKLGNPNYKNDGYGKKIEAAILSRRSDGKPSIISEDHWLQAIEGRLSAAAIEKVKTGKDFDLSDFSFHLPECFKDSLLKRAFTTGDTLYSSADARSKPWGEVLGKGIQGVQVTSARPASRDNPGHVVADVYELGPGGPQTTDEFRGSQDEFIKKLRDGTF